jgi:hypothetical protein
MLLNEEKPLLGIIPLYFKWFISMNVLIASILPAFFVWHPQRTVTKMKIDLDNLNTKRY